MSFIYTWWENSASRAARDNKYGLRPHNSRYFIKLHIIFTPIGSLSTRNLWIRSFIHSHGFVWTGPKNYYNHTQIKQTVMCVNLVHCVQITLSSQVDLLFNLVAWAYCDSLSASSNSVSLFLHGLQSQGKWLLWILTFSIPSSQKCGILSLFIITRKICTGFVWKNVHGFVMMFSNNPQYLNHVVRLVFKKKSPSSPLFGWLVTIFRVFLRNNMFLEGKMIIYIICSD